MGGGHTGGLGRVVRQLTIGLAGALALAAPAFAAPDTLMPAGYFQNTPAIDTNRIGISADQLTYDADRHLAIATGDVVVTNQGSTYRGDRLVTIYDRSGRVIDARRAERQRRAAQDYFARARQLYLAGHRRPHVGVAASLWQRHHDTIARAPQQWQQARARHPAWQQWDSRNEPKLHRNWAGEALVRREAEHSFAGWQKADFKTPDGQTSEKTLVITIERVAGGGREGRPIITKISGL